MTKNNFREFYRQARSLHLVKSYQDFSTNYCLRSKDYCLGVKDNIPSLVVSNIRNKLLAIIQKVPNDYRPAYSKMLSILSE